MNFNNIIHVGIFLILIGSHFQTYSLTNPPLEPHKDWDTLLKKNVDETGVVNYPGFLQDKKMLNNYLSYLSANPPKSNQSDAEKIAFWINAYNAFTIKLIIENYPLKSIKDIGSIIQIPFINSPWDIKFIKIGDQKMTLNDIEHKILRKEFNEPRIHFAIVCASISCPFLRNEAYTSQLLESQLQEQTLSFINDPSKNYITENRIEISKIFSWFKGDFTKSSTLIEYLNQYSNTPIKEGAKVDFMKYNWGLNGPTGADI